MYRKHVLNTVYGIISTDYKDNALQKAKNNKNSFIFREFCGIYTTRNNGKV